MPADQRWKGDFTRDEEDVYRGDEEPTPPEAAGTGSDALFGTIYQPRFGPQVGPQARPHLGQHPQQQNGGNDLPSHEQQTGGTTITNDEALRLLTEPDPEDEMTFDDEETVEDEGTIEKDHGDEMAINYDAPNVDEHGGVPMN